MDYFKRQIPSCIASSDASRKVTRSDRTRDERIEKLCFEHLTHRLSEMRRDATKSAKMFHEGEEIS